MKRGEMSEHIVRSANRLLRAKQGREGLARAKLQRQRGSHMQQSGRKGEGKKKKKDKVKRRKGSKGSSLG